MKMMTSSIGNRRVAHSSGFTFIEVLLAVVILAGGIVLVYRAFLSSLAVQEHLANRQVALMLLEDQQTRVDLFYRANKKLPAEVNGSPLLVPVGAKVIPFQFAAVTVAGEPLPNMDRVELQVNWPERGRAQTMKRRLFFYHPPDVPVTAGS